MIWEWKSINSYCSPRWIPPESTIALLWRILIHYVQLRQETCHIIVSKSWPWSCIFKNQILPQAGIIVSMAHILQMKDCISRELRALRTHSLSKTFDWKIDYTWGRFGSTVPLTLAVSGEPSPFLLLLGSFVMSVECFVSVFESPSCLPDWVFLPWGSLEAAACKRC